MNDVTLSDAGRYTNVIIEDEMVASYDEQSGEFVVYDPQTDSEDAAYKVEVPGGESGD